MRRYYFDFRDGGHLQTDDDGRDFASFEGARQEATMSLAEMALDAMGRRGADHRISLEVRDDRGPVLKVNCIFEIVLPPTGSRLGASRSTNGHEQLRRHRRGMKPI